MNWNKLLFKTSRIALEFTLGFLVLSFLAFSYVFWFQQKLPSSFISLDSRYRLALDEPILELSTKGEVLFNEVWASADSFSVTLHRHSGASYAYFLSLIPFASYFFLALLLFKLVVSAQKGLFFQKENVLRLRIIGCLLLVWEIMNFAQKKYGDFIFDKYLESDMLYRSGFIFRLPDVLNNPAFAGVLVLILAQAFEHGLKLKEEQELTI